MEKIVENLIEAERIISSADHLIYVTIPMIKNNKLIINAITEIKKAIVKCITSILQYEYLFRRIRLQKNPEKNFEIFENRCAQKYGITPEEISKIKEIFEIVKRHEKSPFEFIRNEKIIILSENMNKKTISIEETKNFLSISKKIIEKTKNKMEEKIRKV
jgi:hypothetical protein